VCDESEGSKTTLATDNPLRLKEVLQLVLSFVGHKQYLFLSLVNSSWKAEYHLLALTKPCERKHRQDKCTPGKCTSYAAAYASIPRLQLAFRDRAGVLRLTGDCQIERAAGRRAAIQILQQAIELGLQLTSRVAAGAIKSRDMQKLSWLHTEHRCPLPLDATTIAAEARHPDMLRWLQQSGCEFNEHTSYAAARTANNIEVLQLLQDTGCPLNRYACNAAVAAGDLQQLQWLHARGASLATVAPGEVFKGASVPIVHWLIEQGALAGVLSESTMALAAKLGDTELCKLLQAMDCPWDVRATAAAARYGQCDTLRFLREQGCPWDVRAFTNALNAEPFVCADPLPKLQYWAEQGTLAGAWLLNSLLEWAGSVNRLSVAVWLRQQGAQWPIMLCTHDRERGDTPWPEEAVA
jgi:hypothetical protein